MFHEGFACEVLVFTSADNRAELRMDFDFNSSGKRRLGWA
jgi:hypothetical protein